MNLDIKREINTNNITLKNGISRVKNKAVIKVRKIGVSLEEEIIDFEKRRSSSKTKICCGLNISTGKLKKIANPRAIRAKIKNSSFLSK